MAEINTIGELISWKPPSSVPLDDVRQALRDAGLDEALARDMAPRNAFARAAQHMKDGRIIRQVSEDKNLLVFQFTKEYLSGAGSAKEMQYAKECNVILMKSSGSLTGTDPNIVQMARNELSKAMDTRKANDITRIVQQVFEKHEGELISVRDQGGVYFVPERLESVVDMVDVFLTKVGGNLRRFRIAPDGGSTDASVASSINDHFKGMLDQLRTQVSEITGDTSDTVKARRAEQFTILRGKLQIYSDLLKGFSQDIESGIQSVEAFYLERINAPSEGEAAGQQTAAVPFDEAFDRLCRSIAPNPTL